VKQDRSFKNSIVTNK